MALKALNSVGGFSVGEIPANIILANGDITSGNATFTANVAAGNVKTNNLLYANGDPWDFANPAGANTQVQFNNGLGEFAASANFTFNTSTNILTVIGNIVSTNANLGNAATANFFIGAGNNLSNIQGANVSGQVNYAATANAVAGANVSGAVAYATTANSVAGANVSGQVANALIAGTVYTNAQPNITSVGTLTGLGVNGTVTAVNFTANTGIFTGDGGGLSNIAGGNVSGAVGSATLAGHVTASSQSNITSVGTLTGLTVNGVSNLGPNGNVIITGGSAGYLLQTNGSGNLTWIAPPSTSTITNGTSNISIPVTDGNVNISVDGNANVVVVTDTGANVDGTLNVVGNANVGNLGTGGLIVATGNVTGGNLVTAGNVQTENIVNPTANTSIGMGNGSGIVAIYSAGNATQFAPSGQITLGGASQIVGGTFGGSGITLGTSQTDIFQNRGGNVTVQVGTGGTIANTWTFAQDGSFTSPGNIITTANANVGNLTATGNVNAANFMGALANGTSNVRIASVNGNVTVTAAGNTTLTVSGTGANITGTANISGNANTGNLGTNNFVATGTGSFGGNVNMGTFHINNLGYPDAATDAATKSYVDTMVSTTISYHQPVQVATTSTLAVATGGTTAYNSPNGAANGIGAYISTTGTYLNIDGANVQTVGTRILVKDEANAAWNGVYTYANTTAIVRATDADEYGSGSSTLLGINDYFFTEGGIVNEGSAFIVSAPVGTITFGTSNITFALFSTSQVYDAGTGLTLTGTQFSITNTAVTSGSYGNGDRIPTYTVNEQGQLTAAANVVSAANAANLTGTTLAATIVTSSLTTVGTLGSLAVTANITAGNVYANSGTIGAGLLTGTLTTNAQPNVTSVGTLTSLTVSGTATAGNLSTGGTLNVTGNANVGNIGANNIVGTLSTNAQPNITSLGVLNELLVANTILADGYSARTGSDLPISTSGNGNLIITTAGTGITDFSGKPVANISTISVSGNANVGNLGTGGLIVATGNVTGGNLKTGGLVLATGNVTGGNLKTAGNVYIGNTFVEWSTAVTSNTDANLTIASTEIPAGVSGFRYLVKGVDSLTSKYSVCTVQAVTDGGSVEYTVYGGVNIGGPTGTLVVKTVASNIELQVTATSSSPTTWVTQIQII